jgi:hypothetical protein
MFDFIFKKLSPQEFALFFEKEIYQARVFFLSFAPDVEYAREVIKAYNDEDFTSLAREYLGNVEKENADARFTADMLHYLENRLDKIDSAPKRKNMVITESILS